MTQAVSGTELKLTGLSYLMGNPTTKGKWQEAVRDYDAIINLAGAFIFSRWTPEKKRFC